MTLRRKGLTSQLGRNFVEDDAGTVLNSDVLLASDSTGKGKWERRL